MKSAPEREQKSKRPPQYVGFGLAVGAGLGVALGNIAVGVAVGLAIGVALDSYYKEKRENQDDEDKDGGG